VIFRTAGAKSPLEACFTNEMVKLWKRDDELSDSLGTQDRSGIYGAFHLYRFQT
jgi:S-adenosylmethionine-diacylglycerol 3-amino-3-carboxypropyl transferase